jgi:hypothetical protein
MDRFICSARIEWVKPGVFNLSRYTSGSRVFENPPSVPRSNVHLFFCHSFFCQLLHRDYEWQKNVGQKDADAGIQMGTLAVPLEWSN